MEALFRQVGFIPASVSSTSRWTWIRFFIIRSQDGQILEKESLSRFDLLLYRRRNWPTPTDHTIRFYLYFDVRFSAIEDLIWALPICGPEASDRRTPAHHSCGEGLQHQDGHIHLFSSAVPNLLGMIRRSILQIGVSLGTRIKRMYVARNPSSITDVTMSFAIAACLREGCSRGILKGLYRFRASTKKDSKLRAQSYGHGHHM